ncbi:MAG: cytidine deaminase [Anaerolineales bacterium]|nr:cytidine deaminase [Anaerolineales bacterium]
MPVKNELSAEERKQLVAAARAARGNAYAPYSKYPVGAAIRTSGGKVYAGANVENASYPVGLCAERVALFSAAAAGEREFRAVAVVTREGAPPCGACRQALAEFGLELEVIMADEKGWICQVSTLDTLLPSAFGGKEEENPHR